jgi:uroporphyrinogen-III synthase
MSPFPLEDRRILVTGRAESSLARCLRQLGAVVLEVPLIETLPPEDLSSLDSALEALPSYDWLVLTSGNAVRAVSDRLRVLGKALPPGVSIAAVGPGTAGGVRSTFGRDADLTPEVDYRAEGLLEAFRGRGLEGCRMLFPASDRARETLPQGLRDRGAKVDVRVAYRTVRPVDLAEKMTRAFEGGIDLVTVASPSAVEAFAEESPRGGRGVPVAALGPVTAEAAREAGLDVRVVATESSPEGFAAGIRKFFGA